MLVLNLVSAADDSPKTAENIVETKEIDAENNIHNETDNNNTDTAVIGPKIQKINNEEPDEFEKSISQALLDLEMNSDMKAHLRELHIKAAKEVDVGGKRAIVIFVPPPQLKSFQKVQTRLVRELEKKFAGKVSRYVCEPVDIVV